jgi:hypothetical protein
MDIQELGKVLPGQWQNDAEMLADVDPKELRDRVMGLGQENEELRGRCRRLAEYVRGERRYGDLLLSDIYYGYLADPIEGGAPEGGGA